MSDRGKQQKSLMSEVEGEKRRAILYQGNTKRRKKDRTFFLCHPVQDAGQVVLVLSPRLSFSMVTVDMIGHRSFSSFIAP